MAPDGFRPAEGARVGDGGGGDDGGGDGVGERAGYTVGDGDGDGGGNTSMTHMSAVLAMATAEVSGSTLQRRFGRKSLCSSSKLTGEAPVRKKNHMVSAG